MKIIQTALPGVVIIEPAVFADQRGFFLETYQEQRYREAGLDISFVQDNHSRSGKGVLRGLHYQLEHAQGKLVRVSQGRVFDVAVDIRFGSPTFGQWHGVVLDDQNHRQFYVPPGFAHGFYVLSETADFIYKCTDYYYPGVEFGIAWNDTDIAVDWPIANGNIVLSDRDQENPALLTVPQERLPVYTAP